jgi:hypothetical protein
MNRPITILSEGHLAFVPAGVVLVGWSIDTGGRGAPRDCIGEVLIAARDHINKRLDDMLKALPETAFDEERVAAAKSAAEDIWKTL